VGVRFEARELHGFHSVLIGMMRSSGIPARFEIGFPLPENKNEGDIPELPLLGGILT